MFKLLLKAFEHRLLGQRALHDLNQTRRMFMTHMAGIQMNERYSQAEVIALQAVKIRGLKLQMRQMNRGYRNKMRRMEKLYGVNDEGKG